VKDLLIEVVGNWRNFSRLASVHTLYIHSSLNPVNSVVERQTPDDAPIELSTRRLWRDRRRRRSCRRRCRSR
jgi:hypothetical protein